MELEKTNGERVIRVFVADSSRIHTQLLSDALKRDPDLRVIRADSDSDGLIAEAMASDVDVIVISSNLDEQPSRGFEVLHELRLSWPKIRAVVLLDSSKKDVILEAFRAGARGIFSRHNSLEMLCKCIRCVAEGQIWANSREMGFALEALASSPAIRAGNGNGLSVLSKREADVVQCLAEGLTNREIAERLNLSQHTVKNYLFRVFDKLGVSSRVELLSMTLSRSATGRSELTDILASADQGNHQDEATFLFCKKAAEQGVPAAQMALAQMYWARRSDADNLMHAYMWYLIAADQLAKVRNKAGLAITPEQLIEAERRAAEWLRKTHGISPVSVNNSATKRRSSDSRPSLA